MMLVVMLLVMMLLLLLLLLRRAGWSHQWRCRAGGPRRTWRRLVDGRTGEQDNGTDSDNVNDNNEYDSKYDNARMQKCHATAERLGLQSISSSSSSR